MQVQLSYLIAQPAQAMNSVQLEQALQDLVRPVRPAMTSTLEDTLLFAQLGSTTTALPARPVRSITTAPQEALSHLNVLLATREGQDSQ